MMKQRKKRKLNIATPDEENREASAAPEADSESPQDATEAAGPAGNEQASDIKRLTARVSELEEELLRAKAEQQNIRKRAANELADAVRFANSSFARGLFGILDDFDRTLEQSASADAKTVLEGVRLIYDNLMKVLSDHQVEIIDALDRPFDPRFHEAVMQQPAGDKEPGTVLTVLQKGFKLGDRVLRPAKVIVVAGDGDAAAQDRPSAPPETGAVP